MSQAVKVLVQSVNARSVSVLGKCLIGKRPVGKCRRINFLSFCLILRPLPIGHLPIGLLPTTVTDWDICQLGQLPTGTEWDNYRLTFLTETS